MGFLLVVAVAFVAAENSIELELVQDLYTQNCGIHNSTDKATCQNTTYCWWNGTSSTCHSDPCLKWIGDDASDTDCGSGSGGGVTGLTCTVKNYATYTPDCSAPGTTATKKYCTGQTSPNIVAPSYCTYEYIKSNRTACQAYFCEKGTLATGFDVCLDVASTSGSCPDPNNCSCLTETYCALNPYCYVHNHQCIEDLCTDYYNNQGQGCASRKDYQPGLNINDDCVAYTVFDGDTGHANGDTKELCVNSKKNPSPNKCYFLWNGYTQTGTAPCITYTLPKCAENEECKAETNTSGPYADFYCGDNAHTSSSSLVNHIPAVTMIVLAVLAFLL